MSVPVHDSKEMKLLGLELLYFSAEDASTHGAGEVNISGQERDIQSWKVSSFSFLVSSSEKKIPNNTSIGR